MATTPRPLTAAHVDGAPYNPAASDAKVFYVSAIDSWGEVRAGKRWLVAGPYPTHAAAVDALPAVRMAARKLDYRADGLAWGTAGSAEPLPTLLGPGPEYARQK